MVQSLNMVVELTSKIIGFRRIRTISITTQMYTQVLFKLLLRFSHQKAKISQIIE